MKTSVLVNAIAVAFLILIASGTAAARTNLAITNVTVNPQNPVAGQVVTVTVTIRNSGDEQQIPQDGCNVGVNFTVRRVADGQILLLVPGWRPSCGPNVTLSSLPCPLYFAPNSERDRHPGKQVITPGQQGTRDYQFLFPEAGHMKLKASLSSAQDEIATDNTLEIDVSNVTLPAPRLCSITPNSGRLESDTTVTLTGNWFMTVGGASPTVKLGALALTLSNNPAPTTTQVAVTVPRCSASGPITITNSAGVSSQPFTIPPPTITRLEGNPRPPRQSKFIALSGGKLIIYLSNFTLSCRYAVELRSSAGAPVSLSIESPSRDSLTANLPSSLSSGSYVVWVKTPYGDASSSLIIERPLQFPIPR